jgi:hypothetical protein
VVGGRGRGGDWLIVRAGPWMLKWDVVILGEWEEWSLRRSLANKDFRSRPDSHEALLVEHFTTIDKRLTIRCTSCPTSSDTW